MAPPIGDEAYLTMRRRHEQGLSTLNARIEESRKIFEERIEQAMNDLLDKHRAEEREFRMRKCAKADTMQDKAGIKAEPSARASNSTVKSALPKSAQSVKATKTKQVGKAPKSSGNASKFSGPSWLRDKAVPEIIDLCSDDEVIDLCSNDEVDVNVIDDKGVAAAAATVAAKEEKQEEDDDDSTSPTTRGFRVPSPKLELFGSNSKKYWGTPVVKKEDCRLDKAASMALAPGAQRNSLKQGSFINGGHTSFNSSARPSLAPWIEAFGTRPVSSPSISTNGKIAEQKREDVRLADAPTSLKSQPYIPIDDATVTATSKAPQSTQLPSPPPSKAYRPSTKTPSRAIKFPMSVHEPLHARATSPASSDTLQASHLIDSNPITSTGSQKRPICIDISSDDESKWAPFNTEYPTNGAVVKNEPTTHMPKKFKTSTLSSNEYLWRYEWLYEESGV